MEMFIKELYYEYMVDFNIRWFNFKGKGEI